MPRRFDAESLDDDDLPERKAPKRSLSPWLIFGIAAGVLLLAGAFVAVSVYAGRLKARNEMRAAVERAEADEVRFRAVQADREPRNAATVAAEVVDLQAMAQAYRSDEVSADAKYTGRQFRFRGVMHHCEKIKTGGYVMSFQVALDGGKPAQGFVHAYFPESESDKLAKFQQRSPVQFTGRCEGWVRTTTPPMVAIRDCRIATGLD